MIEHNPNADTERLSELIGNFEGKRVLLVGDLVADHYIKGKSSRISREAPVLILRYQEETVVPGQVGNTAANIAALGGDAMLAGVVGNDVRGEQLLAALGDAGVNTENIIRSAGGATLTKTRILAGGHHTARQQVIRIDDDERLEITSEEREALLAAMARAGEVADAIIVSDYGYGAVDDRTWQAALKISEGRGIPVVLDSRYALSKLKGATLVTPNEEEALALSGFETTDDYDIEEVGKKVRDLCGCRHLIITRGNEGMVLFPNEGGAVHLPIFGSDECTDVTGAGDTVVATATLALAAGATPVNAMVLSNLAGALVVMKMGTATVSQGEMRGKMGWIKAPDAAKPHQAAKRLTDKVEGRG